LRDVFAGLRPVEVPGVAGQHDNASGRICLEIFRIELLTQAKADMSVTGKVKSCVVENLPAGLSIGCATLQVGDVLVS
jgi:hypothetical protein